jgi:hypothetical protein
LWCGDVAVKQLKGRTSARMENEKEQTKDQMQKRASSIHSSVLELKEYDH